MDTFWIRIVSQTGVYIIFVAYLVWALRRDVRIWGPFLGTAGYAILFEHLNMWRYAHSQGGYHYHPASWFFVFGDVPLYIPLAWSFIVSTSMALTDRLQLRPYARPFCDALLALLIDLSMDTVAIRLHFWYWHGVSLQDGFFGVPADNFLGWLLVTGTFSAFSRWLWSFKRITEKETPQPASKVVSATTRSRPVQPELLFRLLLQWAVVPPLAYGSYLALEYLAHLAYHGFHANSLHHQLYVLFGILFACVLVVVTGAAPPPTRVSSPTWIAGASTRGTILWPEAIALHVPRQIFHFFALIGLLCLPMRARSPGLWLVALSVWLVELILLRRSHARQPE